MSNFLALATDMTVGEALDPILSRLDDLENAVPAAYLDALHDSIETFLNVRFFDRFAGADDDAKMVTALATVGAITTKSRPSIVCSGRQHNFSDNGYAPFEGMTFICPGGEALQEAAGTITGRKSEWHCTFDSRVSGIGLFHATATSQVRNVSFQNVNLVGGGSVKPSFLTQDDDTTNWWMLSLHNITASLMWSVCGSRSHDTAVRPHQRLQLTLPVFDGPGWNCNNGYSSAIFVSGSDGVFWPQGGAFDSPAANAPAGGEYHLYISWVGKTYGGSPYVTCTGNWKGIKLDGWARNATNGGGAITFLSPRVEGHNAGDPCFGNLVCQDGGVAVWYSPSFNFAMSGTPGTSENGGSYHLKNGTAVLNTPGFDRASAVTTALEATTKPSVYVSGSNSELHISHAIRSARGGSWGTSRPHVKNATTVGSDIFNDTTVVVV